MLTVFLTLVAANQLQTVVQELLLPQELVTIFSTTQQIDKIYRMQQRTVSVQSQRNVDVDSINPELLLLKYNKIYYVALNNSEPVTATSPRSQDVLLPNLLQSQPQMPITFTVQSHLGFDITTYCY